MNAVCRGARAQRLVPFDCFLRGLATLRQPALTWAGPRIATREGVWAAFSLQVRAGRIAALRFTCTNCTTLVACCEALVELNTGCALQAPCVPDVATLWERLPGMPRAKVDRAVLATGAFHAALHRVMTATLTKEAA